MIYTPAITKQSPCNHQQSPAITMQSLLVSGGDHRAIRKLSPDYHRSYQEAITASIRKLSPDRIYHRALFWLSCSEISDAKHITNPSPIHHDDHRGQPITIDHHQYQSRLTSFLKTVHSLTSRLAGVVLDRKMLKTKDSA